MLHVHTLLLLLVPKLLGVVFLAYIVEVAIVIHDPASESSKGIFVPFTLGFTVPYLFVTGCIADARLGIEVDSNRDKLIIEVNGEDFAVLNLLNLGSSKVKVIHHVLEVTANDRRGNRQYLHILRVKLDVALSV